MDPRMLTMAGIVVGALTLGTAVSLLLPRVAKTERTSRIASNLLARMRSWWVMVAVFALAVTLGNTATIVLFGLTSFLAFREFITLTPTARGDHRTLFWVFFVFIPLHYVLLGQERYGLFSIFIPVYAFVLIPARMAAAGETTDFLNRASRIQWGLLTCVYFISHAPALLQLRVEGFDGSMGIVLFYFVLLVQMNDVFQYLFGTLFGRRPIVPAVSPGKTVEGFVGGLAGTVVVAVSLAWATPFSPGAAGAMALGVATFGFLGDITMSAVKRDIGVKDFSTLIPGHGGTLDRIDSLAFTAPLFFHVVRYFYHTG